MQNIKIRRSTFQHVESELYGYRDTLNEIIRIRSDILQGKANVENTGGGRSNLPGDPTGSMATLLVSHRKLEIMERMVTAIEFIYNGLPDDKKKFIQLRYWTRPQTLTWDGVAVELKCHRATALRWRNDIVNGVAHQFGYK